MSVCLSVCLSVRSERAIITTTTTTSHPRQSVIDVYQVASGNWPNRNTVSSYVLRTQTHTYWSHKPFNQPTYEETQMFFQAYE